MNTLKSFIKEEDGLGTVEIVMILAVLVGLAFVFRQSIIKYSSGLMSKMLDEGAGSTTAVTSDSNVQSVINKAGTITNPTPTPAQ